MQPEQVVQMIIDSHKKAGTVKTPEEEADPEARLWAALRSPPHIKNEPCEEEKG